MKETNKSCSQSRWQRLEQVLDECVSLAHRKAEPIRRYLSKQGVDLNILENVRQLQCHPELPYPLGERRFPALISSVHVEPHLWVNLHCTYLTQEGDLAPLSKPKRLINRVASSSRLGGAVRLFPVANNQLALVEDIETALLVYQKTGLPCWAALSEKHIAQFVPPDNVHALYVMGSGAAGWELADRIQTDKCSVYLKPLNILEEEVVDVLS